MKKTLLWTTQTDALWKELKEVPDGDSFRGQILAAPSGIGKSHISLLLALRCYAANMPVLYIGNAGDYLESLQLEGTRVDKLLLHDFANLNADLVPEAASYKISILTPLMKLLHKSKAVVVVDEHGRAYNDIIKEGKNPGIVFPFLISSTILTAASAACLRVLSSTRSHSSSHSVRRRFTSKTKFDGPI